MPTVSLRPAARGLRLSAFVAATVISAVACARDGNAQSRTREPIVADDTASLARLLAAVRGSDPLLCEMAVRNADQRGWWGHWASMAGSPLDHDSASAAVIMWIQREHNDPAVVPRLRTAMRDADGCVRRVAGSFLGRVRHPAAITALTEALGDANAGTRHVATIGLGLSDAREAVAPLVRALRDQDVAVRRGAAWALGAIGEREAEEPLIARLERDPDPRVRQAAAWAIGQLDD